VALEKSESARRSTLAPRSRRLRNTAPAPRTARTAHDTAYGAACHRCEIALRQAAIAGGVELAELSVWAESQSLDDRRAASPGRPIGQAGSRPKCSGIRAQREALSLRGRGGADPPILARQRFEINCHGGVVLTVREVPSTNAFCRTAPSDRRSLRAICRARTVFVIDFSSRMSLLVHSRRAVFFLAAIVTASRKMMLSPNKETKARLARTIPVHFANSLTDTETDS
jgi:hypothetical protein